MHDAVKKTTFVQNGTLVSQNQSIKTYSTPSFSLSSTQTDLIHSPVIFTLTIMNLPPTPPKKNPVSKMSQFKVAAQGFNGGGFLPTTTCWRPAGQSLHFWERAIINCLAEDQDRRTCHMEMWLNKLRSTEDEHQPLSDRNNVQKDWRRSGHFIMSHPETISLCPISWNWNKLDQDELARQVCRVVW